MGVAARARHAIWPRVTAVSQQLAPSSTMRSCTAMGAVMIQQNMKSLQQKTSMFELWTLR